MAPFVSTRFPHIEDVTLAELLAQSTCSISIKKTKLHQASLVDHIKYRRDGVTYVYPLPKNHWVMTGYIKLPELDGSYSHRHTMTKSVEFFFYSNGVITDYLDRETKVNITHVSTVDGRIWSVDRPIATKRGTFTNNERTSIASERIAIIERIANVRVHFGIDEVDVIIRLASPVSETLQWYSPYAYCIDKKGFPLKDRMTGDFLRGSMEEFTDQSVHVVEDICNRIPSQDSKDILYFCEDGSITTKFSDSSDSPIIAGKFKNIVFILIDIITPGRSKVMLKDQTIARRHATKRICVDILTRILTE